MYGNRARIGLLVPSVNTVVEPEFNSALPDGYSVHAARMRNSEANVEDARAMLAHAERAADELGSAHVKVIAFACTASSFVDGPDGEIELRRLIEGASGAIAITTSAAVRDALQYVGARQISMVTPYLAELNDLELRFLRAAGITVLSEAGMGVEEAFAIAAVAPEQTVQVALKTLDPRAEALFLSCTNLRTFEIIEDLERRAGIPVISSNTATLWASLRAAGHGGAIAGLGQLLGARVAA